MSSNKFTPGPWLIYPEESKTRVYIDDTVGSMIADCTVPHAVITKEEREANAKLIAAAPELLDAAEYAMECLERLNTELGQIGDNGDQAFKALKDAIAKATT